MDSAIYNKLTDQEKQIVNLLNQDYSNEEIKRALGLTDNAFRLSMMRIRKKIEVHAVAEWVIPRLARCKPGRKIQGQDVRDVPEKDTLNSFFDVYQLDSVERNIILYMASGFSHEEIAEYLDLTEEQLRISIIHLQQKLGVYRKAGIIEKIYIVLRKGKK